MNTALRPALYLSLPIITGAFLLPGHVHAAGEARGDLDVTIRVIDSKQGINEFINRIELPRGTAGNAPAASTQPQESASEGSGTGRKTSADTERKRNNTGKNQDKRRSSGNLERNDDDQPDPRLDSPAQDRQQMPDHRFKDSGDLPRRTFDSRDRRENMQSHSREQRESAREKSRDTTDGRR